jgi:CubicO group peptidase (beta-lactamase class C family)
LFEPLISRSEVDEYEAAAFAWPVDPQGRHAGFGLLKLLPRDLARIGQLYLNEGKWKGEQLLPADWVAASTTTQVEVNDQASGCGYLWWIKDDGDTQAYLAWGFGGQAIRVIPDLGLAVARASEIDIAEPSEQGSSPDAVSLLTDQVIAPLLE